MSSDKAVIQLGAIPKGERITIMAIAACGSTGTIILRDDSTVYATLEKTNSSIQAQLLGPVSGVYTGANLRLELNISHTSYNIKLKSLVHYLAISDGPGDIKGGAYTVAVEDYTDNDYNDYVISVVSTKKVNS
ncbi:MAG: hypothetical protein LBC51_06895 [Treponema sp.]|jgi:hypothetical protein|nr:hypothetical protein [Treponema sp.]